MQVITDYKTGILSSSLNISCKNEYWSHSAKFSRRPVAEKKPLRALEILLDVL